MSLISQLRILNKQEAQRGRAKARARQALARQQADGAAPCECPACSIKRMFAAAREKVEAEAATAAGQPGVKH